MINTNESVQNVVSSLSQQEKPSSEQVVQSFVRTEVIFDTDTAKPSQPAPQSSYRNTSTSATMENIQQSIES